MFIQESYSAKG